jgi:cytochrome c oxidase subunit I+III
VFKTPMLFALAFILQFTLGGITGVMTAAVPFDWQGTDTYFVVGHLHYVLAGSSVFALFAAIYYWYPKMVGRMLSEQVGKLSFWLMVVGFNVAFFPMHIAGLLGMPRRIYTYQAGLGLEAANLISTVGTYILAIGIFVTLWNAVRSRYAGAPAGHNPWGANSLEWLTPSPPPAYNFEYVPVVSSREPLWDGGVARGPAFDEARLTPRTSPLDATLEGTIELPEDNVWTLVMSLALLFVFAGLLARWYGVAAVSGVVTLLSIARWLWPRRRKVQEAEVRV